MDSDRWRVATVSLAFLLVLFCVAWVMREQSIADDRRREREQWEADRQMMVRLREDQSQQIERLDLAVDELRRKLHHATTRATTQPGGENE